MAAVPLTARFSAMRHGYVIELKCLGRAAKEKSQVAGGQAERPLRDYWADPRLPALHPDEVPPDRC